MQIQSLHTQTHIYYTTPVAILILNEFSNLVVCHKGAAKLHTKLKPNIRFLMILIHESIFSFYRRLLTLILCDVRY